MIFLSACIRQFLASAVTGSLLSIPQNTKNNIMQCSNIGHTFLLLDKLSR